MNDRPKRNTPAGEAPQGAGLLDKVSRGHFGTSCPEAAESVPTPEYLNTWDNVSFDDKRRVVDLMITTVAATSDSLNITWKI